MGLPPAIPRFRNESSCGSAAGAGGVLCDNLANEPCGAQGVIGQVNHSQSCIHTTHTHPEINEDCRQQRTVVTWNTSCCPNPDNLI